jgi:hypothetical protein
MAIHVVAVTPQSIACCRLRVAMRGALSSARLVGASERGWSVINYHSRRCGWRSVRSASVTWRHSMSCENQGARRALSRSIASVNLKGIGASIKVMTLRGWPSQTFQCVHRQRGDHEGSPYNLLRSALLSLFPISGYRFPRWPDPSDRPKRTTKRLPLSRRIDGGPFCCNDHPGVVGAEAGVGVTNS